MQQKCTIIWNQYSIIVCIAKMFMDYLNCNIAVTILSLDEWKIYGYKFMLWQKFFNIVLSNIIQEILLPYL